MTDEPIAGDTTESDPTVPPGAQFTMDTYATVEELNAYLEAWNLSQSDEAVGQLQAASSLIKRVMRNYDEANETHVTAASNAVCAQVHFWMVSPMGDEGDMVGAITARSANPITTQYSTRGNLRLAPRAGDILRNAGLLFGGVRMA